MCHEAFPNVEMCQIANSPEVELDPMNLCLCPNCASEYKKMRADEYDLEYFLEDIENLSDAEIGSMDPVEVAFGNETIWFTQTHIAEIRELRALQEAVDKYKDSAGSGQKKPVDKPVQEDDDPEAEVVVSGTDIYKDYIGKRVYHKGKRAHAVVKTCDGKYLGLKFENNPGKVSNFDLEMCLSKGWIEIV